MSPIIVLAAAAAKDPPIIDLDSTVFLQFAIFAITAYFLSRLLFRPYLRVKTERTAGIEGARDEARRLDEESSAKLADYESKLAAARTRASAERGKVQSEGVARERDILAAARQATHGAVEAARQKMAADADATRRDLEPRAREIAATIAKKILGREVA